MKIRADSNDAFPESGNVRMRQVVQFLAMSESSVYRLIKDTDFPRPVHLSSRLVVFGCCGNPSVATAPHRHPLIHAQG